MEKKKINKWIKETVKIIVSFVAISYVCTKIDTVALFQQWEVANKVLLFLSLIFFVLSKLFSAVRLNIYFKNINVILASWTNIKLYLLGMFYNLFLPGGIGGDGYKVWALNKQFDKGLKVLSAAVLLDRINGMVAIIILLLPLMYFLPLSYWMFWSIPVALVVGYLLYILFVKYLFPSFFGSVHTTTLLPVGVQMMQCISVYLIMKSIGLNDHYFEWMFVFMLSSIVAVLPMTVGGLGAREVVFLYASQWLGIQAVTAVSISLLFYLISALTSLIGLYYHLNPSRLELDES